jgi:hypothetical protein
LSGEALEPVPEFVRMRRREERGGRRREKREEGGDSHGILPGTQNFLSANRVPSESKKVLVKQFPPS